MRFQDAAKDARAVVYAGIQADPLVARAGTLLAGATTAERLLARAAMNGERTDPETWRLIFPALFGEDVDPPLRDRAEKILAASLEVAERGEAARSSYRGALVEEVKAGSWAELGSLYSGDLILEVDGAPINNVEALHRKMDEIAARKTRLVVMKVLRGIHTSYLEMEPDWK